MSEHTTHASLLARLADGSDELAWQEFCRQYGDLIRRVARRRGLQPADGDDIVQDVLVRLARAMPGFEYDRGKGRFRGYLKTVVLHAIADRFCQKAGQEPVRTLGDQEPPAATVWPEADQTWEQEWRIYHVERAMRTIEAEFSEKDRRAFTEYARRGRPAAEVAEALGLSIDQVYQARSRIVRRLGALIAGQVEEEG